MEQQMVCFGSSHVVASLCRDRIHVWGDFAGVEDVAGL